MLLVWHTDILAMSLAQLRFPLPLALCPPSLVLADLYALGLSHGRRRGYHLGLFAAESVASLFEAYNVPVRWLNAWGHQSVGHQSVGNEIDLNGEDWSFMLAILDR